MWPAPPSHLLPPPVLLPTRRERADRDRSTWPASIVQLHHALDSEPCELAPDSQSCWETAERSAQRPQESALPRQSDPFRFEWMRSDWRSTQGLPLRSAMSANTPDLETRSLRAHRRTTCAALRRPGALGCYWASYPSSTAHSSLLPRNFQAQCLPQRYIHRSSRRPACDD